MADSPQELVRLLRGRHEVITQRLSELSRETARLQAEGKDIERMLERYDSVIDYTQMKPGEALDRFFSGVNGETYLREEILNDLFSRGWTWGDSKEDADQALRHSLKRRVKEKKLIKDPPGDAKNGRYGKPQLTPAA